MSLASQILLWSKKLHRWASYLLFIPLIFWIVGGAFMVLVPLTLVRGDAQIYRPALEALPADLSGLPEGVVPVEVRAKKLGARRVLEVQDDTGKLALYERGTFKPLSPISEGYALDIARWHSSKAKELGIAVHWIAEDGEAPSDYRRSLPVWMAERTDGVRLYISPDTGEIVARRSKIWRLWTTLRRRINSITSITK